MTSARRLCSGLACAAAIALVPGAAPARADLGSLKAACAKQDAADFVLCDDGVPQAGGTMPNQGAVKALAVPERYAGYAGLPPKASPDPGSGADRNGDVALDADVSLPDPARFPPPAGGYPLIVLMHTCCAGDKHNFEASTVDGSGETWHYSNAWFASRGYVVLTYTSRGFVDSSGHGSTGQMQLDSRRYEVNDFQDLACQLAGDPFFHVDPRRVGISGGSYGGGLSWLAVTDPDWTCGDTGRPRLRMHLAAAAPRYGWSDLLYSLVPNGTHQRDALPPTDPAAASELSPFGFPRKSITGALFATGAAGQPPSGAHTTFPSWVLRDAACLQAGDPYEDDPLCGDLFAADARRILEDSSPYYQNDYFARLARGSVLPVPVFSAGSATSPLFSQVEHREMVERLRAAVPGYPVEEYYGDIGDFTQDKAKEWGDLCGTDRHVCTLDDYPGGDAGAVPPTLQRVGVTTRLDRFLDHYLRPPADAGAPRPLFDATVSLRMCSGDAPGDLISAPSFAQLAPRSLRLQGTGAQTTSSSAAPNPHAATSDPIGGAPGGNKCPAETTPAGPGVATYDLPPLASDVTTIGRTRVTVPYSASGSSGGLELNARLYDLQPGGPAVLVDRGGVRLTQPAGQAVFDLNGTAWRFPKGDRVRIELAQDDDPYVARSSRPSAMTLAGVTLDLPVR